MSTTSEHASEPAPSAEDFRNYAHRVLTIVEEQYEISTDRLTDGPAEQDVLERLVEEVKPTMPAAASSLHHFLGMAFRYDYWKTPISNRLLWTHNGHGQYRPLKTPWNRPFAPNRFGHAPREAKIYISSPNR